MFNMNMLDFKRIRKFVKQCHSREVHKTPVCNFIIYGTFLRPSSPFLALFTFALTIPIVNYLCLLS